ncbi:MAG: hemerythrin domain-containing protein [Acidimicrobiales bacterium]
MADFVTVLTEDHRRVEQLLKQFDETGDPAVAQQIFLELSVHTMVEEELLYSLYFSKVDSAGVIEARADHQEAKDLIVELEAMDPDSDEFVTTMTKLKTSVLHHVDEEEREMFPKIIEALPDTARLLGNDIVARKAVVEEQLLAGPARMPGTSWRSP